MGVTKQTMIEEHQKELLEADREHDKFCPLCDNELSREDCEALQHSLEGN